MADSIDRQNEIRVRCHYRGPELLPIWVARIGPDAGGLVAIGDGPNDALELLAARIRLRGWIFDPDWRPRK